MATSCDKNQWKLLLGKGNLLLLPKRSMFFERSINTWVLLSNRLPKIVYASLWKMVNFALIFSEVDSSAHTICSCISYFQGTRSDFFRFFFVSQILLPRHTKNNFETETKKTWKSIYWSFIRHNSLIFHALFLLFCSSHESSRTFKLTSPVL